MAEIKELTDNQYEILSRMDSYGRDYCYGFSFFDDLKLTKKELSKEFKILREAGLVFFQRGLLDDDGMAAGSGYGIDNNGKVQKLLYLEDDAKE